MAKRILIISASIGGGHVAAARALEAALSEQQKNLEQLEFMHVDLLDYTSPPFRRLYSQAYFDLVRGAPEFVDWLGNRLDRQPNEQSRQRRLRARATRLISYHLPRLIRKYKPDAIVHTHFLAPEILSATFVPKPLRFGSKERIPQYVVITDYFAHSLWVQPNIDAYFVATEEVKVHLEALGVESKSIFTTGIPIDPRFSKLEPAAVAKKKLGYKADKDLVLMMASGLEFSTLKPLIEQLKALKWLLNVVIICGRSEDLKTKLEELISPGSELVSFSVLGFTKNIPDYMAAADLLVGKPGGLTTSESLAACLPFAIVQPYPLQEEANTNFLLEHGAAFRIEPLTTFSFKLKRFLSDEQKRQDMRLATQKLAKASAAQTIVCEILNN